MDLSEILAFDNKQHKWIFNLTYFLIMKRYVQMNGWQFYFIHLTVTENTQRIMLQFNKWIDGDLGLIRECA